MKMLWFYLCGALVIAGTAETKFAKEKDVQQLTMKVDSLANDVALLVQFMNAAIKEQNEIHSSTKVKEGSVVKKAMNDSNIEDRVVALEEQMTIVNADIADLDEQVENAEAQIVIIKSDQVLQDQRILELEDDTEVLDLGVQGLEGAVTNLEAQDTVLNSSINQLETEITGLTVTAENLAESVVDLQETDTEIMSQISNLQEDVTSLEETDVEHTASIESLMSNVEDLTGSVNELDSRLDQLEYSGAIAFQAYLGTYDSITIGTIVFDNLRLGVGGGFSTMTGQFTTPSDGAGLYYVYAHFQVQPGQYARFEIHDNDVTVCGMMADESAGEDQPAASCGALVYLNPGDVLDVYYAEGPSSSLWSETEPYNSFTAFRIAPA